MAADDHFHRSGRDPWSSVRRHLDPISETYRRTGSVSQASGLTRVRVAGWLPAAIRRRLPSARRLADRVVLSLAAVGRRRDAAGAPVEAAAGPPDGWTPPALPVTVVTWGPAASVSPAGPADVRWLHLERPDATALASVVERDDRQVICVLAPTSHPADPGWLAALVGPIEAGAVATTPLLVHPRRPRRSATPHDGRARELGLTLEVADGVPRLTANRAGQVMGDATAGTPAEVDATSAACVAVARAALADALGDGSRFGPGDDLDSVLADVTLGLHLGGSSLLGVPEVLVIDERPVGALAALGSPVDPRGDAWAGVVGRRGPALVRAGRGPTTTAPPTFAITTAAPSEKVATQWGDWHFAQALARALRARNASARVQTFDHCDGLAGRSCDVHLVVRGLRPVERTTGQRHVLWIISHPELVTDAELDAADLVLVASTPFGAALQRRTSTPVEVLLQATDHHRFRPLPPDPALAHPLVVVAKTRDVLRPIVADALAAGLEPTIFGSGWEGFVDADHIAATHVANEQLPLVYSSAGVLLNDHWTSMRELGFVSNRIFDALACGTPVVSDHLPEIADLFGPTVRTYRTVDELRAAVDDLLADPVAARERAAEGRQLVLAAHTMDHRAARLLELVGDLG
jgi:hypothetical protein